MKSNLVRALAAVVVGAMVLSGAPAQIAGGGGISTASGDVALASLVIQELPQSHSVELSGTGSNAFAIMLLSYAPGSWDVDFGGVLGVVHMDVLQPIDFFLGQTDDQGYLSANLPFVADLPPQLDGAKIFAQVVSFTYYVDESASEPTYIFSFVNSNVVQSRLRRLSLPHNPSDG